MRLVRIVGVLAFCGITATAGLVVPPMLSQARKEACSSNLRRIGEALLAYESLHRAYPAAAITSQSGRPLLSWRVRILPQLGFGSLYEEFHRDEPWDSPHNLALLKKMPREFLCPCQSINSGFVTGYQVVVGPKPEFGSIGTMFEWARGVETREVIDGTSNTIAVTESRRLIPWTKPDDLKFDQDSPLPELASGHEGGFHVLFGDGATRFLKATIDLPTLRSLLTRDGNEVLTNS